MSLQVTRIVLLWVNNHFNDFEGNPAMTRFLEDVEKLLEMTVRHYSAFSLCLIQHHENILTHENNLCSQIEIATVSRCHNLPFRCTLSENERPSAPAEHRVRSQG